MRYELRFVRFTYAFFLYNGLVLSLPASCATRAVYSSAFLGRVALCLEKKCTLSVIFALSFFASCWRFQAACAVMSFARAGGFTCTRLILCACLPFPRVVFF